VALALSLRLCRSESRQFYSFGSRVTKSYDLLEGTARASKIAMSQDLRRNEEMIRANIRNQEIKDKELDQLQLKLASS
jgi:hypothetical protein